MILNNMDVVFTFIVIAIALFVAAFITKRRFGLLGLALATGSLLSGIWGFEAGLVASFFGLPTRSYTTAGVLSIVVLLPAIVLLFHGNTYKTMIGRVIGACLFALLAIAFLIEPLSQILIPQGLGTDVYWWLTNNRDMIIGVGLITAVVDIFLTKPTHHSNKRHGH